METLGIIGTLPDQQAILSLAHAEDFGEAGVGGDLNQ